MSEKSAAIGFSIITNHPFVDGNKRTGFLAMDVFLRKNGFFLLCSTAEGEEVTLGVASGTIKRDQLAEWIELHRKEFD